ncbi:hypothetical protein GGU10DRAFT_369686 [Lentinula aff. detonsa]|uniref:Uncharacterized protein n=1 Tax=Lentinula aff. detonsa TaxID=2804958 RepID=A0AA38KD68_9AGAR|nr:hypothetical protein GGU10DRAFT_369686 [Lentinula aff. detonsa]
MFKAFVSDSSRFTSPSTSSLLHTSAVLNAPRTTKKLTSKAKTEIKAEKWRRINANLPSPVFGTRKGEESKWDKCYLAQILVNEAELSSPPQMTSIELPVGTVQLPSQMGFGVTDTDAEKLFRRLPELSLHTKGSNNGSENEPFAGERENIKANTFAKVLDLRNADSDGIAYENKRRIIVAFSTLENQFDPGRTEVQAAILTFRIRNLGNHFPRDLGNRLGLRKLLGLERESVEGEFIV